MIRKIIFILLVFLFSFVSLTCASEPPVPAQQGVSTQQLNQKIADLEKRIKTVEDTSPATFKSVTDLKKDLDEIKLRINLIETRPIPSGLSPDDRNLLDNLDKRVKSLEPTPTPRPAPGATPTATPTPPAPPASAAALTTLERRVNTLEQQVQQLGKQPLLIPTPVQTTTPTPTPTPKVDLRVVNHSAEVDRVKNIVTISGEVVNLGNVVSSTITVLATLYKIDGTTLGGGTGTPVIRTLAPLESTPFSFTISNLDLTRFIYTSGSIILRATTTQ